MNTSRFLAPSAAAVALLSLVAAGCSRNSSVAGQPTPVPSAAMLVTTTVPAVPVARTVPIAVQSYADQSSASWLAIKDYTYDQRSSFVSGASSLQSMLAAQVAELNRKRASMPSSDDKDWDFAMKEMNDSQAYLKSMIDEAARATPDTWGQEKDKVDQAWQRAQEAFDKVKVTTTT